MLSVSYPGYISTTMNDKSFDPKRNSCEKQQIVSGGVYVFLMRSSNLKTLPTKRLSVYKVYPEQCERGSPVSV